MKKFFLLFFILNLSVNVFCDTTQYWENLLNIANEYMKSGMYQDAIISYNEIIKNSPDIPQIYNNLGIAYEKVGNFKKALENYQIALSIEKDFSEALNNLALFYLKQNINIDAALAFAQRSIQLEEKPAFFDTVSQIYEKKGLLSKALEYYDHSLTIHPEKASTTLRAARILLEMKRYDSAMKYLEKLVNAGYKGIDFFLMRISLLKKTGKFTEAHIQIAEIINSYNKTDYSVESEKALKDEIQSYFRTTVWTAALTYYRIIYSQREELPDADTLKSMTRIFYDSDIPFSDNDGTSFFINRNGIVESRKYGINPDIFDFINFFAVKGREIIEQICRKNQEIITISLYEYIMTHDSGIESVDINKLNIDSDIIKCPAGGSYYLKNGKVVCEKHGQLY